jgi:glyoxylase-like metal-dependent hydrolase (beta-lactamase superfamily II)
MLAHRAAFAYLYTWRRWRAVYPGLRLFPGGVRNSHKNKAHFTSLINDVEHKLFDRLPDDTWFYPGHGKDSTLGAERPHLAEWRARGW